MDEQREQGYTEETPKAGTPWGFFLVLAAIFVVAIVYSVSIYALAAKGNITPETVFGAMAACFTVIGTLVGTYFGIKAGLDGQDKVRQTLARAGYVSRQRAEDSTERDSERIGGGKKGDEPRGRAHEDGVGKPGDREGQGWEGVGV